MIHTRPESDRILRIWNVEHCPQYMPGTDAGQLGENLLVQEALWNAVRIQLVSGGHAAVELRIASHAHDRSLSISLILSAAGRRAAGIPLDTLDRMLPDDYGWSASRQDSESIPEPERPGNAPWRVARLVRRMEFFDLPADFPWMFERQNHQEGSLKSRGHGGESAEASEDASGAGRLRPSHDANAVTSLIGSSVPAVGRRIFPVIGIPVRDQVRVRSICLPLIGDLQEMSADRQRVCLEMQQSAPVVLSVVLHPIDNGRLDCDRTTATHFRRCLEPLGCLPGRVGMVQSLSNAGFSRFPQLQQVYDRYWLPHNYLCNVTMRVAATHDGDALAVAHCIAARLGGMRAFEILPPTRDLDSLSRLSQPSADVHSGAVGSEQGTSVRNLRFRLGQAGVELNELYTGFLLRMPHLYTLDETRSLLRIPFAGERGLPGIPTRLVPPFYSSTIRYQPLEDAPPGDEIRIGMVRPAGRVQSIGAGAAECSDVENSMEQFRGASWHSVKPADLTKHAALFGRTGSGKSVASRFLLRELTRLNVPFLVIEPIGGEYFEKLRGDVPNLQRWCFDGTPDGSHSPDYLYFDPMRLQPGVEVGTHVSYLKSCFQAAFPMLDVQAMILETGLYEYYLRPRNQGGCGLTRHMRGGPDCHQLDEETGEVWPSFRTFHRFFIDSFLPEVMRTGDGGASDRSAEFVFMWQQMFRRRFDNLVAGPLGTAFARADAAFRMNRGAWDPFRVLVRRPTVIELRGVPDREQKSLIMAMLLTFLYEHRDADDRLRAESGRPPCDSLQHVLLIEEAHRLLERSAADARANSETVGESSRARAVSLFVDMIAEIRKYGQGVIIVEQIPTKIVSEAVKNSNLKIMFQLPASDDREFLGNSMNFTEAQKQFVNNLRTGEFVAFEENIDQPLLLTLPHPDVLDQMESRQPEHD